VGLAYCDDTLERRIMRLSNIRWHLEKMAVLELHVCKIEEGDGRAPVSVRQNLPPVQIMLMKDRSNTPQAWQLRESPAKRRKRFIRHVLRGIDVNICRGVLDLETRTIHFPLDDMTYDYVRAGQFWVNVPVVMQNDTATARARKFSRRGFRYLGTYNEFTLNLWLRDGNQRLQDVADPNLHFMNYDAIIH
jgi:hypothetical protein